MKDKIEEKKSAASPEMICLNCKHYDTIWLNCKFLGFDGVRENPNMRCNIEIETATGQQFAFEMRSAAEVREEEIRAQNLLGDDTVQVSEE